MDEDEDEPDMFTSWGHPSDYQSELVVERSESPNPMTSNHPPHHHSPSRPAADPSAAVSPVFRQTRGLRHGSTQSQVETTDQLAEAADILPVAEANQPQVEAAAAQLAHPLQSVQEVGGDFAVPDVPVPVYRNEVLPPGGGGEELSSAEGYPEGGIRLRLDAMEEEESAAPARVSPYFASPHAESTYVRNLDDSVADFQDGAAMLMQQPTTESVVQPTAAAAQPPKQKKGKKKRKADSSIDEDGDEGSCCTICFEPWSNSGDHRISSLRCGHFFGYICIEKWLKGTGSTCPNCNEKSTKKDIRVHYVSKLKAIDTSEKDRALADLDKTRAELRELELRHTEVQVRLKLQLEEIERLSTELRQYRKLRGDLPPALLPFSQASSNSSSSASAFISLRNQAVGSANGTRLVYKRRHEIIRASGDKACRVLAFSDYLGMLVISQPSFTALAPGYGVRQFNVLDQKVGNFISLCKDQVRDLSFAPTNQHLLLSSSQDKTAKITNMSNGHKVFEYTAESQIWACDWSAGNDYHVYLGTQRGSILVLDIRSPDSPPTELRFPDGDKKPIIGLRSVPAAPEQGFPRAGFLVMNLTSLWFWCLEADDTWSYYKLPVEQRLLWSLDYERESRLVLVGCKPSPLAAHIVLELTSMQLEAGRTVTCRTVMSGRGGSFSLRSFLRSSLIPTPSGQVFLAFTKGSGLTDHKVIIQEVGTERIIQELRVDRPVIDIKAIQVNTERYLALLGETELVIYQWCEAVE